MENICVAVVDENVLADEGTDIDDVNLDLKAVEDEQKEKVSCILLNRLTPPEMFINQVKYALVNCKSQSYTLLGRIYICHAQITYMTPSPEMLINQMQYSLVNNKSQGYSFLGRIRICHAQLTHVVILFHCSKTKICYWSAIFDHQLMPTTIFHS